MALESEASDVVTVIKQRLHARVRYRCVVVQGRDLAALSRVSQQFVSAFKLSGNAIEEMDALAQFDDMGAISCDKLIEHIKKVSIKQLLLITGPLHFLDYWPPSIRAIFWNFLAAFSNGPGIVVTDVFRSEPYSGSWKNVKGFGGIHLRCLKSRLESTEDYFA